MAEIRSRNMDFFSILNRSEDQELFFKVYNMRKQGFREVKIVPTKAWPNADSLLGVMIRYENIDKAYDATMKIMNVAANSPAAMSGIIPSEDYLLGITQYIYANLSELSNFIENLQTNSVTKSIEMALFNEKTQNVRFTIVLPNRNWGGRGLIGCEFGTGLLHRVPRENIQRVALHELQASTSNLTEPIQPQQPAQQTKKTEPPPLPPRAPIIEHNHENQQQNPEGSNHHDETSEQNALVRTIQEKKDLKKHPEQHPHHQHHTHYANPFQKPEEKNGENHANGAPQAQQPPVTAPETQAQQAGKMPSDAENKPEDNERKGSNHKLPPHLPFLPSARPPFKPHSLPSHPNPPPVVHVTQPQSVKEVDETRQANQGNVLPDQSAHQPVFSGHTQHLANKILEAHFPDLPGDDARVITPRQETIKQYTFFSSKLETHYVVRSTELFDLKVDIFNFK